MKPPILCVYGSDKIGKTTFAAGAPTPLFVSTEEGAELLGPDRLPVATSFLDFIEKLKFAASSPDHKTLVIDHLSGVEDLAQTHLCKQAGVSSIEQVGGGYGKGYTAAEEIFTARVLPLVAVARDSGKCVILIAHSRVKRFDSPETEPYDQFQLDLHERIANTVAKFVDVLGFMSRKVAVESVDVGFNQKVRRAVSIGDKRGFRVTGKPAFLAGNRLGLQDEIACPNEPGGGWRAFAQAMADAKSRQWRKLEIAEETETETTETTEVANG